MVAPLLVIVPTRSRPDSASLLAQEFYETSTTPTDLLFAVDDDDPRLDEYLALESYGIWVEVAERMRMIPTLNHWATQYASRYRALGFMGDDHLPRTHGWDTKLLEELLPGGVIYGNDLFQGPNLPTAVVLDSRIVQKLGYMVPPGLLHMFADNAWRTWGERTNRLRYLPDVIIEHMHPQAGKGDVDDQYTEVWDLLSTDATIWQAYVDGGALQRDIDKLMTI